MYLHLGSDTVVPLRDVIAITDLKNVRSGINEEFLKTMREENMIVDVSEGSAKSFVITDKVVYMSAISSVTLKKRAGNIPELDEE